MDSKINAPKLLINNLVLIGKRKTYHIPFTKGLNIIYGDSDTGKSSILNLIDYCLGASKVYLYDEIESAGLFCLLEIEIFDQVYTIKRDIFNVGKEIDVYKCPYHDIENHFPKSYASYPNTDNNKIYFSEFLLSTMNIPIVKVKQAPTKEDSTFSTVSFRDIFKYCFLNQDTVGSVKIFGDNPHKLIKLKESFKLMFNVLDLQILEMDAFISQKTFTTVRNCTNNHIIKIIEFIDISSII
jgi:AAA15 family ATPase/GTPase